MKTRDESDDLKREGLVPTSFITIDAPGASTTDAYGINDAGQIVGSYNTGDGPQGFLLSAATPP